MNENYQVVTIKWKDACMLGTSQISKDDKEIKLASGCSAGMLVKETDEYVAICTDIFDTGEERYRTVQVYPKNGIISMKKFNFK